MICRIERVLSKGQPLVLRVSGRIQPENLDAIRELLKSETGSVALDLHEVTIVDRDVVRFLGLCEGSGIELRHCPAYMREWIVRERAGAGTEQEDRGPLILDDVEGV